MKYRTVTRPGTRTVRIGDMEYTGPGTEQVREPVPPRDPRAAAKTAMFRLAVGFTVLAMALTIAAVGTLLHGLVPSFVAYPAGAVYDGLWIFALLGEWLAQFQPRPRRAARLT